MNHVSLGSVQALRATARKSHRPLGRGRQASAQDLAEVRALIGPGDPPRDMLIEHLHALHDAHGALRETHLVALAQLMRLSVVEVHEVASFYDHFDISSATDLPVVVRVCRGLSCELAGATPLADALMGSLASSAARIKRAPCMGQCDHAPAASVAHTTIGRATVDAVAAAMQARNFHENSISASEFKHFVATNNIAIDLSFDAALAAGAYRVWQSICAGERPNVVACLKEAGLRGLGGAGFEAARKWGIVQSHIAALGCPGVLVVNLDEGEPGTFKDRWCLETDPHRMIEGMLIAAQVVGCDAIYIYLRDEYHDLRHMLTAELASVRHAFPNAPPMVLRRGAGAYICGEESALIESLEGKRGEPRLRPPYIAERGLFGRPTLAHNGETLFWLREILERGPQFFAGQGRHGRTGLRRFSVSGRVKLPGVKLAPAGITLRELIDEHCGGMQVGHSLYAFLPGGASGGIFPAALADVPLDFDTLQPHGGFIGSAAVIVLGHLDRARDAALNMMEFFAHESCGQCTPCRVGTAKAAQLMQAPVWDRATLEDLNAAMQDASICGLGQAAPNPVACVLRYFEHEVDGQLDAKLLQNT